VAPYAGLHGGATVKRPKAEPKDSESIDWQREGFEAREEELGQYPNQAEQYFDAVRALQAKNEAAGHYTVHDAATLLAQSRGNSVEWWRSRMCADWLLGLLKMRDGSALMTIDPPARPTDPKKLSEWEAAAGFGASWMRKEFDPTFAYTGVLDVVSVSDLDEWLRPHGFTFTDALPQHVPITGSSPRTSRSNGTSKVWTEERKAEARAYRLIHGLKKTAAHYQVSQTTISKHIPVGKPKPSPQTAWGRLPRQ